jgi:hypothetical protein
MLTCLLITGYTGYAAGNDKIIFTANQNWLSRIYVLDLGGGVVDFHEYDFYRFCGMEVVEGELYVAEAFAPRLYKVDPQTGNLEVIVDDWSLYYFYDVAFDGTYFYLDEWDLNRYDIDGNYAGTAAFDEYVLGCAWDGQYFWTLDDHNLIKCWNLSAWPEVRHVPSNDFVPPSPQCRGLWFDGEYFWSAESGDTPGTIYKFNHHGDVVRQWDEPAFSGWGAVLWTDPATVAPELLQPDLTLSLRGNHPNPFNPTTVIRFELERRELVELSIYDVLGRKVNTLLLDILPAGCHEKAWHADGLASGVYWARLAAGDRFDTHKMVLLK